MATPLERQFSAASPRLDRDDLGRSTCSAPRSITLQFDLNRSLDGAAVDTQAAITQASKLLPNNMPTPPTFTKVNPADQPIIFVALTSKMVPLYRLTTRGVRVGAWLVVLITELLPEHHRCHAADVEL